MLCRQTPVHRLSALLIWLSLILPLLAGTALAQAKPAAPAAALSPAQAREVLDVLQNDNKRTQFIAVLENMAKALPPAAAPAAAAAPLRPDGIGAQLLKGLSHHLTEASQEFVATAQAVTDFPLLVTWVEAMAEDPGTRTQLLDVGWKLAVVITAAGLAEALTIRLLRRTRRAIDQVGDHAQGDEVAGPAADQTADDSADDSSGAQAAPAVAPDGQQDEAAQAHPAARPRRNSPLSLLHRIPFILARLAIDLVPVGAFALVAYGLLGTPVGSPATARLVILALVNAYLAVRLAICAARLMVSPVSPRLRLIGMSDHTASYVVVWVRRLTAVAAFGYALTTVADVFGLYPSAQDAMLKLVALVDHIFLVVIVLQCRHAVAARIAPPGSADRRTSRLFSMLRRRLAGTWHYLAIFYIVALWLVWALEVRDGFSRLLRFFLVTVAVITATRFVAIMLLGALDRLFHLPPDLTRRYPDLQTRAGRYYQLFRGVLKAVITALCVLALFEAWGLDPIDWFVAGALGSQLVAALGSIGLTLFLTLCVWEFSNAAIERRLDELSRDLQAARSARLRTLLPMLRTTLFFTLIIVAGLMVLSQVGINIAPLLAGAGVVGVAVGFGSQKLVQDIITGLFLLLENAMQVGDTVALAGLTGTVEYLSIRTIRLRALDGSVHIIPFSAVTSVTNMTRDYSFAMVDIEVGFNEEPDQIAQVLREMAGEMREEPAWKLALISDLEIMGVEKFTDTAWVMRLRIRTQPTRRWAVQRELNRRIKYRFDKLAIESPFTSTRILSTVPGPVPVAADPPPVAAQAVPPVQATVS